MLLCKTELFKIGLFFDIENVYFSKTELFEMEPSFDIETVLMLNWIVWNRTVYMYKNGFGIDNLQWLI